jgi:succinyldiaminopimelate transaminase
VRLSPVLEGMGAYPFVRLAEAKRAAQARGLELLNFGVGEPREETPAFIRRALAAALEAEPVSTYPAAEGLPELRAAIAGWLQRRFGATLDPDREIIPTLGTKEAIFHLPQVVAGPGARVAVPTPGYPVPARGAAFAGAEVVDVPLDPARGWEPDLDAVDWTGVALLWLNFPNNPTGATTSGALLERAAALGREHGFVVASDEAYSELWFSGAPPVSILEVGDRAGVIAFNTLSKRSSMPGYRSGFAAGDPDVVAALRHYRPNVGVAPQAFVQRAAAAAWGDEAHVEAVRRVYRAKRDALEPALRAAGLEPAGGPGTFFLWLRLPDGRRDDEPWALELLNRTGIVVAPGSFFGPAGSGHVRVALVPTLEACQRAAELLESGA